jgi:hypothetical protein
MRVICFCWARALDSVELQFKSNKLNGYKHIVILCLRAHVIWTASGTDVQVVCTLQGEV